MGKNGLYRYVTHSSLSISCVHSVVFLLMCVSFCIYSAAPLGAQKILTIEDALKIALIESNTIKRQQNTVQQSNISYENTKASQRTNISLNIGLPTYRNNITEYPSDYGNTISNNKSVTSSGTFTVAQPFRWTNGTFTLNTNYSTLNNFSDKRIPHKVKPNEVSLYNAPAGSVITLKEKTETHTWGDAITLNYSQPLFQPNTQKTTWDRTVRDRTLTQENYKQTENGIWRDVLTNYYNLYKTKRNFRFIEDDFNGKVKNADIAEKKICCWIDSGSGAANYAAGF